MHLVRKYRLAALFCAVAVLICELISRPYANMGIADDGPYILVGRTLASTGHIVYNGWSAAMLVWQLYLAAIFIKLFGFSFTAVRMSTLLVSLFTAFLLQRVLVRCGISERNSLFGTLAFVLSPLYLMLSVTFMSDIHGLFGIVICLYACLRALQSPSGRASICWLLFAVAANVVVGTSRQLAWLAALVMVPCAAWLLRSRPKLFLAGLAAAVAGFLSIAGCLLWLKHQPYTTPGTYQPHHAPWPYIARRFSAFFMDFPFLLLPAVAPFLLSFRKSSRRVVRIALGFLLLGACLIFTLAAFRVHLHSLLVFFLEPTVRDFPGTDWVTIYGEYTGLAHGTPALFLPLWSQGVLTVLCAGGTIGLVLSFFNNRPISEPPQAANTITGKQCLILLAPFATAYVMLLLYRAVATANDIGNFLFDRYGIGLLLIVLIFLMRQFQEKVATKIPLASYVLVLCFAVYGVSVTHNTFALYRARLLLAAELGAAHYPDTLVDNGWEYNLDVELEHSPYLNNPDIVLPAHAYVPTPSLPPETCFMIFHEETPHIHPVYGISFDPNACYGPAPFAPVHYSRWLAATPGTLYAVHYAPPAKP